MKINNTEIKVIYDDITEQKVDAIVNAANNRLQMGGGVAGAIRRKGGKSIQDECNKIGTIAIGEAVITGAGNLKAKYVIHAATMGMDFKTDEDKIRDSFVNSLRRAEEERIGKIAFPALGCGVGGFELEKAAKIMFDAAKRHILTREKTCIKEIIFVMYNKEAQETFLQAIGQLNKLTK